MIAWLSNVDSVEKNEWIDYKMSVNVKESKKENQNFVW